MSSGGIPIPEQHSSSPSPPPGGWNSLSRFAESFSRAQTFLDIDAHSCYSDSDPGFDEEGSVETVSQRKLSNAHETTPLVIKKNDSPHINCQSTVPQSVFNGVNFLVGIGLLSLPLAFRLSGWIFGVLFLLASGLATLWATLLLAKCLESDSQLSTYVDVAGKAYGWKARYITSLFIFLDLTAANVALICLFADSLNALLPSVSVICFKLVAFVIISPLTFVSLRYLSFTSVVGIIGTSLLLLITVFNGLYNCTSPGSLLKPAETAFLPSNPKYVALSLGLFMSPFGGIPVFPSVYRDMRHPVKFPRAATISYGIATGLEFSMGVTGYLMFGSAVLPEITQSVLDTGRVVWLNTILVAIIAIVPVSKIPLAARPIAVTLDGIFKVHEKSAKVANRILANAVPVLLSILFPKFERVVSFAGALLCFTICVVFPLLFYMKIFKGKISLFRRILMWTLVVWGTVSAIIGTISAYYLLKFDG